MPKGIKKLDSNEIMPLMQVHNARPQQATPEMCYVHLFTPGCAGLHVRDLGLSCTADQYAPSASRGGSPRGRGGDRAAAARRLLLQRGGTTSVVVTVCAGEGLCNGHAQDLATPAVVRERPAR